jgi:hypothetical protein
MTMQTEKAALAMIAEKATKADQLLEEALTGDRLDRPRCVEALRQVNEILGLVATLRWGIDREAERQDRLKQEDE